MRFVQPIGWCGRLTEAHQLLRHIKKWLRSGGVERSPAIHHIISAVLIAGLLWGGMGQPSALARTEPPRSPSSIQPYIDRVVDRITDFTLDNGMKFIVMERHQAPVVSFMTYVDVGAAYEEKGKTGAAHFLEHLAFKGTTRIGTQDYSAEKPLLEQLDALFDQIQAAKAAGDEPTVTRLQQDFERVKTEAASYVKQNEMGQVVEQSGGEGLNATTSADETRYFYSFPSNKLELWMSLESERFLEPVFREFYEEKDVILEERRMRTDNSPIGKMIETFLETAFPGYPYGRPIIGYDADIRNLRRQDIQTFFDAYYTPSHMIAAVVGDVDPAEVNRLAEVYFGRYQVRSEAPDLRVSAPEEIGPKEVVVRLPTQPWYLEGYLRPPSNHPDDVVYQIIGSILTDGRTSRLYKSLVDDQQLALSINASNGFPGDRFTNIMLIYALTAPGHTVEEVATAMDAEIQRLKDELVSPEELERVKNQSRTGLLGVLASNQGMASLLPEYEATRGNWRTLFEELKAIEATTAEDIQRVARETFIPQKLTIGKLLPLEEG
jgi:predicted Zn-dependent peptidase